MNSYFPHENERILGFLPIPAKYASWVELLVIQLITPNASFVGHLAGILVGLLYLAGPLKFIADLLGNTIGMAGGTPTTRQSDYEPSAPPFERDDYRQPSSGIFGGQGATASGHQFNEYTGGLTEEEQMRRAMEESTRHRSSYGWR